MSVSYVGMTIGVDRRARTMGEPVRERLVRGPGYDLRWDRKDASGIFPGAVVILRGVTPLPENHPGLIYAVYPDNEPTTDQFGVEREWPGQRPLIDVIAYKEETITADDNGSTRKEVVQYFVRKIAWESDVREQVRAQGMPMAMIDVSPRYLVIRHLSGH